VAASRCADRRRSAAHPGARGEPETTTAAIVATASAEPTEVPTPVDPEAVAEELATTLVAGDVVPDEVYSRYLPRGMKAYEVADGTRYVVESTKPLPEPVRSDMQARLDAAGTFMSRGGPAMAFPDETGKYVLSIFLVDGSPYPIAPDGTQSWAIVGATGQMDRSAQDGTKATAIAIAERHVAAQAEPERWEIIIQNR